MWTDIEVFRRLPNATTDNQKEKRESKVRDIREKWMSPNYFLGSSSPAKKEAVRKVSLGMHVNDILSNVYRETWDPCCCSTDSLKHVPVLLNATFKDDVNTRFYKFRSLTSF